MTIETGEISKKTSQFILSIKERKQKKINSKNDVYLS
jgi:hypothetical protein